MDGLVQLTARQASDAVLAALYGCLADLAASDGRLPTRLRLHNALGPLLAYARQKKTNERAVLPAVRILAAAAKNEANATVLGKAGGVACLLALLVAHSQARSDVLQPAARALASLAAVAANVPQLAQRAGLRTVLGIFVEVSRHDVRNRQVAARLSLLAVLKNATAHRTLPPAALLPSLCCPWPATGHGAAC